MVTEYVAEGTKVSSVSEMRKKCSPVDCLARMILGEAGNQPKNEMIAVAYVAENRLQFPSQFGSDIKSVVLQGDGGQFNGIKSSYALNPTTHSSWSICLDIAKNYLNEENPINHCLWFNTNAVFNKNLQDNGGK